MMRLVTLVVLATLLLTACGQSRVVRREPAHAEPRRTSVVTREKVYGVRQGDTLYGIAFRHGLDFRDVAAWNRIGPPYTIYPGQQLRLRAAPAVARTPASVRPPVAAQRQTSSRPATPVTGGTGNVSGQAVPRPAPPVLEPRAPTQSPSPPVTPAYSGRWLWPTAGQIIGRFVAGEPTKQGIDIAGAAGQPVVAASDGVVVYSGTGLVGYGEVIIVKHSDEWLSAYGHNRKRLVAEGDAVKGGQTIAELGRSGTSRDMLHFEIRRNGKPVDPLGLLPPR